MKIGARPGRDSAGTEPAGTCLPSHVHPHGPRRRNRNA